MSKSNTPTSPEAQSKRLAKKQQREMSQMSSHSISKWRRIWYVCAMVSISLIVGFMGSIIARNYPTHWPYAEFIIVEQVSNGSTTPELIFVNESNQGSATEIIDILQDYQRETIITIYPEDVTEFAPENQLGKGVIVSADGWIMVLSSILTDAQAYTVVLPNGEIYTTRRVIDDSYSGISFIDIQATQLPVAEFKTDTISLGEQVILYTDSSHSGDRVSVAHIENPSFNDATEFTTEFYSTIVLVDHSAKAEYLGSPVFDSHGNLVGLNALDHVVVPVEAISSGIYELFSTKTIARHTEHIIYEPTYRQPSQKSVRDYGVTITQVPEESVLEVGDVLLSVDGVNITQNDDLSIVLAQYETESVVEVKVLRLGTLQQVELVIR